MAVSDERGVGLELIERLGIEIGPRLAGSDEARRAADAVAEAVGTLGLQPVFQEFKVLCYVPQEPELEVAGEPWDAAPCTWAHASPPDGVRGRARRVGMQPVIPGMVAAPAFTIEDEDGQEVGQLFGNPFGGPAIPLVSGYGQLLTMPSAWISAADADRLDSLDAPEVKLVCGGEFRPGVTERNVLVELPGETDETVVISCHLDTVRGAPGVIDNASGAQGVFELLRRFQDRPRRRRILACFFAAEEIGLLGARFFVSDRKIRGELSDIAAVVNLDCIARGEQLMFMADPDWLRDDAAAVVAELNLGRRNRVDIGPVRAGSDHLPFSQEGIPAVWLAHWPYREYHTAEERMELVDRTKLQDAIDAAEKLVDRLARR
jgi:hypothetical protein